MAKVTSPPIISSLSDAAKAALGFYEYRGQTCVRAKQLLHTLTPEEMARAIAQVEAATEAWYGLSIWKRNRWSLCAWKNQDAHSSPDAKRGSGGFFLYLQCWLKQGTVVGTQPQSPCSRRIADSGASPFDYTP